MIEIQRQSPGTNLDLQEQLFTETEKNYFFKKETSNFSKVLEDVQIRCFFGFIRLLESYYLIVVTNSTPVASIHGHVIHTISDTVTIPITFKARNTIDEVRYKSILQRIDFTTGFYFSFTYDLTNSLQNNTTKAYDIHFNSSESSELARPWSDTVPFQDMFVWNFFAIRPFLELYSKSSLTGLWTVPIIYGYLKQRSVTLTSGCRLRLTLIGRRSRLFAGTRYLRRGSDIHGDVANEVETEQIVTVESPAGLDHRSSSLVQLRGSIPLYWSHYNLLAPSPPIELERMDSKFTPTRKHFTKVVRRYGPNVVVFNLVRQSASKREELLGTAYREVCEYLARRKMKLALMDELFESRKLSDKVKTLASRTFSDALDFLRSKEKAEKMKQNAEKMKNQMKSMMKQGRRSILQNKQLMKVVDTVRGFGQVASADPSPSSSPTASSHFSQRMESLSSSSSSQDLSEEGEANLDPNWVSGSEDEEEAQDEGDEDEYEEIENQTDEAEDATDGDDDDESLSSGSSDSEVEEPESSSLSFPFEPSLSRRKLSSGRDTLPILYKEFDMLSEVHGTEGGEKGIFAKLSELVEELFSKTGFFVQAPPGVRNYCPFPIAKSEETVGISLSAEFDQDSSSLSAPIPPPMRRPQNMTRNMSFSESDDEVLTRSPSQSTDAPLSPQPPTATSLATNMTADPYEEKSFRTISPEKEKESLRSLRSPVPSSEQTSIPSPNDSQLESQAYVSGLGLGASQGLLQRGVFRTNCVDCLDRTNVGQFCYAKTVFTRQLKSLGLELTGEGLSNVLLVVMNLWVEHGDEIAKQYGGSGAMHRVDTDDKASSESGSREFILGGGAQNAVTAVQRYYSNISSDYERQQALDLLLGVYSPQKEDREDDEGASRTLPQIWDLKPSPSSMRNVSVSVPLAQYLASKTPPSFSRSLMTRKQSTMTLHFSNNLLESSHQGEQGINTLLASLSISDRPCQDQYFSSSTPIKPSLSLPIHTPIQPSFSLSMPSSSETFSPFQSPSRPDPSSPYGPSSSSHSKPLDEDHSPCMKQVVLFPESITPHRPSISVAHLGPLEARQERMLRRRRAQLKKRQMMQMDQDVGGLALLELTSFGNQNKLEFNKPVLENVGIKYQSIETRPSLPTPLCSTPSDPASLCHSLWSPHLRWLVEDSDSPELLALLGPGPAIPLSATRSLYSKYIEEGEQLTKGVWYKSDQFPEHDREALRAYAHYLSALNQPVIPSLSLESACEKHDLLPPPHPSQHDESSSIESSASDLPLPPPLRDDPPSLDTSLPPPLPLSRHRNGCLLLDQINEDWLKMGPDTPVLRIPSNQRAGQAVMEYELSSFPTYGQRRSLAKAGRSRPGLATLHLKARRHPWEEEKQENSGVGEEVEGEGEDEILNAFLAPFRLMEQATSEIATSLKSESLAQPFKWLFGGVGGTGTGSGSGVSSRR